MSESQNSGLRPSFMNIVTIVMTIELMMNPTTVHQNTVIVTNAVHQIAGLVLWQVVDNDISTVPTAIQKKLAVNRTTSTISPAL